MQATHPGFDEVLCGTLALLGLVLPELILCHCWSASDKLKIFVYSCSQRSICIDTPEVA